MARSALEEKLWRISIWLMAGRGEVSINSLKAESREFASLLTRAQFSTAEGQFENLAHGSQKWRGLARQQPA
jgi:hypothetical protein